MASAWHRRGGEKREDGDYCPGESIANRGDMNLGDKRRHSLLKTEGVRGNVHRREYSSRRPGLKALRLGASATTPLKRAE